MKKPIASLLIVLGSALALPATAQMGGGMGMGGMGMGGMAGPRAADCAKATVPADCEAHRKAQQEARATAREKCKDTTGAERRKCLREVTMAQARTDCAGPNAAARPCMRDQAKAAPAAPSANAAPPAAGAAKP